MLNKFFYLIKPIIPRRLQLYLRRMIVKRRIKLHLNDWPILNKAAKTPENWQGWPGGKKFAFVLTHDVEHQKGHDKCIKLMTIEKELGFKSSFNFVPERYTVSESLRTLLRNNGFEVGVHGLKHDGKLFNSEEIFCERAIKINQYLKEWNAVGFRAPAMHHNLEWIKKLNIEYDLSTFDTDPFEPQSDGVETIFPFIIKADDNKDAFVEIPYTLVQDFTLFILMKDINAEIWIRKLEWIAEKGGMALLNVHPDYIDFENSRKKFQEFPVNIYIEFLNHVKRKYEGLYWNALPRELASFWMTNRISHMQ